MNVLTSAAREGCRFAVVTEPDVTGVNTLVTDVCNSANVTPSNITVVGPDPADIERRVTVTVETNFQIIPGQILGTFSGTVPMRAVSVMRHESL